MKNVLYKITGDFDIKKNYKLFRVFQRVLNPTFNKKNKYEDIDITIDNRIIPARVFSPFNDQMLHKVIIFIHGGGWVSGSLESYTNICYNIAKYTGYRVISIGYRLAPEHPFPAGFNDCYDVVKLIYNNLSNFNITSDDVVLMGDSAGGNLCASVSQKALDTKEFRVKKQILLYPTVQSDYSPNTKYKSILTNGDKSIITRNQLCDFISYYLPNKDDYNNKYVAPIKSHNMFGLPKTLLLLSENDPLRDEGIAYARKLRLHFVNAKYYVFKGAEHGFITNILDKKYKKMAIDKIKQFLEDNNEKKN